MSAPRETGNEVLFDLPLGRSDDATSDESGTESLDDHVSEQSIDEETTANPRNEAAAEAAAEPAPFVAAAVDASPDQWTRPQQVTLRHRIIAGLLDLGVAVSVLTIVLAAVRWMGVETRLAAWPGFAAFLLSFSFLYFVIPLSFWGQTPGMSWVGIAARWDEDLPLSFGQSTQRWIGAILSLLLLGLPLLLGERTLADRLSGTTTVLERNDP